MGEKCTKIYQPQMAEEHPQPHIEITIDPPNETVEPHCEPLRVLIGRSSSLMLAKFHAGCFRISLSLCSQALLWKTLVEPVHDAHAFRRLFSKLPSTAFVLLWSLALFTLASQSLLYILRCFFHFEMVKKEFSHHVGVNYLFAPWISWLMLLQSSRFIVPSTIYYQVLWCASVLPIVVLDVKIYGQWFTKGPWLLSTMANPAIQLSVIGNFVGARAAAQMGWRESALCMFSLGMTHYLVLFVTLYQRLSGSNSLPVMLRPVFFLFIATPSMASLAWESIAGSFDVPSKMLFFLSLFLFMSLVCQPALFKGSMRRFSIAWWAYPFPLTVLAMASTKYAQEVRGISAHTLMLLLSAISVLVCLILMITTALCSNMFLPRRSSPVQSPDPPTTPSTES